MGRSSLSKISFHFLLPAIPAVHSLRRIHATLVCPPQGVVSSLGISSNDCMHLFSSMIIYYIFPKRNNHVRIIIKHFSCHFSISIFIFYKHKMSVEHLKTRHFYKSFFCNITTVSTCVVTIKRTQILYPVLYMGTQIFCF